MHVTYDNKQLPVIFDYVTMKRFAQSKGSTSVASIQQLEKLTDNLEDIELLCFLALERGHKKENLEFTYKLEDMEEIFGESFNEFMTLLNGKAPAPVQA